MQKLNKNGTTEAFIWSIATEETTTDQLKSGKWLVSTSQFIELSSRESESNIGVYINPDDNISHLKGCIEFAAMVAINFPAFADGRGFSIARKINSSQNFSGEIIAIGNFMQDQLHYLMRCGFNGFVVNDDANVESMTLSLNEFSDAYQASANNPTPLFRRRS